MLVFVIIIAPKPKVLNHTTAIYSYGSAIMARRAQTGAHRPASPDLSAYIERAPLRRAMRLTLSGEALDLA